MKNDDTMDQNERMDMHEIMDSTTHNHNGRNNMHAGRKQSKNDCLRRMIRPGLLFCCVFVFLTVTGGRFLATFLEQEIGMTTNMIGFCLAMQRSIITVSGPIVGPWADRREARWPGRGRAEIIAFGVLVGCLCSLLHGLRHLSSLFSTIDPSSSPSSSSSSSDAPDEKTLATTIVTSTWFHFALRMGYAFSFACILPVLEAVTLQYLEQHPQLTKDDYGRERLFGAVGWAISHVGYAVLIDRVGFSVTFPLIVLVLILCLTVFNVYIQQNVQMTRRYLRKKQSNIVSDNDDEDGGDDGERRNGTEENLSCTDSMEKRGDDDHQAKNNAANEIPLVSRVFRILRLFFGTCYSSAFMFSLFVLSYGQATVDSLLFLFFETLDSSYTMMGITVLFTVAFEIPIFQVAPTLLKYTSPGVLLMIGGMCYVIRVLGYASIPSGHIAYVLIFEPLHGVTYACAQTAAIDMAAQFSPVGWEATGQGLIAAVRGCGSVLGLFFGGWALQNLGGRFMYKISACFVFFGVFCLFLAHCFCNKTTLRTKADQGPKYVGLHQSDDDDDNDLDNNEQEAQFMNTSVLEDQSPETDGQVELQRMK